MSRIKEYPSITSFDGTSDALAIEQTDGANNRTRKVSPAQLKQYMEAGDFEATGEVGDGHGNILADMAKSADVNEALDNSKIATFMQSFSNVNITSAWGSIYISGILEFDISALGLQSVPKFASLTVMARGATVITIIDEVTTQKIKFYISRPNSASNVTVHMSALIVY